jgi:hypothetical protein
MKHSESQSLSAVKPHCVPLLEEMCLAFIVFLFLVHFEDFVSFLDQRLLILFVFFSLVNLDALDIASYIASSFSETSFSFFEDFLATMHEAFRLLVKVFGKGGE